MCHKYPPRIIQLYYLKGINEINSNEGGAGKSIKPHADIQHVANYLSKHNSFY